jgi:hypothetical protein
MVWKKLKSVDDEVLSMDALVAVGIGTACVYKDGRFICDGNTVEELRVKEIERAAALDPDHDWIIIWNGPLTFEKYQRQGEGCWRCVERGEGFA